LIQEARNAREVRRALKLVAPLKVAWPTEPDCARALADFTAYHLSYGLGLLDALIATCAVGLSGTLYTFNNKHYRVVPGLVTAQPYTRYAGKVSRSTRCCCHQQKKLRMSRNAFRRLLWPKTSRSMISGQLDQVQKKGLTDQLSQMPGLLEMVPEEQEPG
jgi:hypothetical protein